MLGSSDSISMTACLTARRAISRSVATTAKSAWPRKLMSWSTKSGSSPKAGDTSFLPGMSDAVRTTTTPGTARTAETSREISRPRAFGDWPTATWRVPSGSRMSSMYCAEPCTCLNPESCGTGLRTWRSDSVSVGGLVGAVITLLRRRKRLALADDAGGAGLAGGGLAQGLEQEVAGDGRAIGGGCPVVVQGLVVAPDRRQRLAPGGGIVKGQARERPFGLGGPLRDGRHAAEGDPRLGNAAAVEGEAERPHGGRDILVEALRDLVGSKDLIFPQLRNRDLADELARQAILPAIGDEEVFERHGSRWRRWRGSQAYRR